LESREKSSIEAARLQPSPIRPAWIIAGEPTARLAELSRARDGSAVTVLWDCTAGEFNWIYREDETVHILEGEATIEDGEVRHTIRAGDVFLFHAGTTWRWRVPKYIKKVAFLRTPIPRPAMLAVRALRKLQGGSRKPELTLQAV
jgi:uncharacterized cupin superfamily protein